MFNSLENKYLIVLMFSGYLMKKMEKVASLYQKKGVGTNFFSRMIFSMSIELKFRISDL